MTDPFRQQLIDELEGYLGHKLFAPEGLHVMDLKAIVETIAERFSQDELECYGINGVLTRD